MGIITKLNLEELNNLALSTGIKFISFLETKHGITDTTYITTDSNLQRYVFKIYESFSKEEVFFEIDILNALKSLKVPQVISKEIEHYETKPYVIYSCIEGKIPKDINLEQIEEISHFISSLHKANYKSEHKNIYTMDFLKSMLESVLNNIDISKETKKEFLLKYDVIKNIDLTNDVLIHGDLFPDNAKFIDNKLQGVYDFSQSCIGNRYFDLSVLIISWCFKDDNFNMSFFKKVLEVYDRNLTIEFIKPYLLYACLYYALQRATRVNKAKDYKEMLNKFDILEKSLDACI